MNKIKSLFYKYREIIVYLIFGVLTTLVDWAVDIPLHKFAHFPAIVSATVAWIAAVAFAFFTNKPIVFRSLDWSARVVIPELLKFVGCRIGSGIFGIGFMFLTVDLTGIGDTIYFWFITHHMAMKVVSSVFVIIFNYIGSKLLFQKKS